MKEDVYLLFLQMFFLLKYFYKLVSLLEALAELEVRTIHDEKGVRAGVFLYSYYNQRNSERVATIFIIFLRFIGLN